MPNQPKTPAAAFRIPAELRERLKAEAARAGKTETAIVIEALEARLPTTGADRPLDKV